MQYKLLLIIVLFGLNANSQHSTRFLDLTKNLKPIDSTNISLRYKNGNIKEKGTLLRYEHREYHIEMYAGKYYRYYKDGKLMNEFEYDKFGNVLVWKTYDKDNNLTFESNTTFIDTKAINTIEFFKNGNHLSETHNSKFYKCSNQIGMYLSKEGQRVNGKKKGLWKIYSENGNVKKEKVY